MVTQLHELRAVIYNRKSTVSDGKSTRDQERENRNWCSTNHIEVDKVITDEGISASRYGKKKRTGWEELKSYLRSGHILVAWEASRATRDIAEGVALINLCAELGVPLAYNGRVLDMTTGDDRFVSGLDFLLAARESDKIKERVERGIRGSIIAGTPHAHPPWGYRTVPRKSGEAARWELDPVESPRVRQAVTRILGGESRKSVFRWLQSTGHAPAHPASMIRVLTNPVLAGKRVHQKKIVGDGTWPAIITEEEHYQMVAGSKALSVTPGPVSTHLCSGVAKCGKCDRPLRYKSPYKAHRQSRGERYACPQGCATIDKATLDKLVGEAAVRRLESINAADYDSENPAVSEAIRRMKELEADLAQWKEKAISEEVSAEMYAAVEKDRKRKIAELQPRASSYHLSLLRPENFDDAPMSVKREHVRVLLSVKLFPGPEPEIKPI